MKRVVGLGIAAVAVLLVGTAAATAAEAEAALKYKQPSCGKYAAQIRKSTGPKKKAAQAQQKLCKANRTVYNAIKDSRITGTRSDGVDVDTIYCANGKWQDDVSTGGRIETHGWRVFGAKVKKNGDFVAFVEAWIPGGRHVQAFARAGGQWQVGWEFAEKANALGPATKTAAKDACAAL